MYKTEIDSQTEKINMVFQGEGRQRNKLGAWNEHIYHTVYKIDNQQGSTI